MSSAPPSEDFLRSFAASLPESYRGNFDASAIAAHARIARERKSAPANIGSFFSNRLPGAAICVVADDRPGLLATISAALVLCNLDVIEAEAYTRRVAGQHDEAVDIFWVRHESGGEARLALSHEESLLLCQTLIGLIEGKLDRKRVDPSSRPAVTPAAKETVVRFIEGIRSLVAGGQVTIGEISGGIPHLPGRPCIGYYSGDEVLLLPQQAVAEVRKLLDRGLVVSQDTLIQRLTEENWLTGDGTHRCPKRTLPAGRVRVMVFQRRALFPTEE